MALRFEDHAGFERTCLIAAAGGALAAYYATWMALPLGFLPWAAAGAMAALVPLRGARRRWQTAIVAISAAGGMAVALLSDGTVAVAAIFALGTAARWEDELPPAACIVAAVALAAGAGLAAPSLAELAGLLGTALPAAGAGALGGAVLGLWMGAATAPLHLRTGGDPVELRLAGLRPRLAPELLRLAERAAAARTELLRTAPSEVRSGLRRAADGLALAALDLAEQGTEVSRERLREHVDQLERAREAVSNATSRLN